MAFLDIAVIILMLGATGAVALWAGRGVMDSRSWFTGSSSTPWWAVAISVIATYVSALSFLGAPAWAYGDGLSALAIHLNYPIVILIVVSLFLPVFYASGSASIYAYLEDRFGRATRLFMSGLFLVTQALSTAAILYATALVLDFVAGIGVFAGVVTMTAVSLGYAWTGGMRAVIWTDVLQAGVLLIGAVIILVMLLTSMPQGLGPTLETLAADGRLNALRIDPTLNESNTVWAGLFAMTLFHITVYGANQMLFQRTLGAATIGDAKKSYLLMGYAALPIYILFFAIGVLAYGYFEGAPFDQPNTIILQFAKLTEIPALTGIIVAAVLCASLSTLSSALNSMATVTVVDFLPHTIAEDQLTLSRRIMLICAILVIIPALLYARSDGSVLELISKIGSYLVGAKLGLFVLGFLSRDATQTGVLIGVAAGFITVAGVALFTPIAWPWYCPIGGGVNIIVGWAASRVLTGKQLKWHPHSVPGIRKNARDRGDDTLRNGWHVLPGRIDRVGLWLLAWLGATLVSLWLIPAILT